MDHALIRLRNNLKNHSWGPIPKFEIDKNEGAELIAAIDEIEASEKAGNHLEDDGK